jgi:alpha-galactosidase
MPLQSADFAGRVDVSKLRYDVQVVDDGELPEGVQRVLVERPGRHPLLLVTHSAAGTVRLVAACQKAHDRRRVERPLRIVV